jgi:hypothetical protein
MALTSTGTSSMNVLPGAAETLASFFERSDNPRELKDLLVLFAKTDADQCQKLVRKGLDSSFAEKCEQNTNQGVIAALIVSVLLAMSMEAPDVNDEDDGWAKHRDNLLMAYHYLCLLGSALAWIATMLSLYWVNIAKMYVVDVDDFIWYVINQKTKSIELSTYGSIVCCSLAMACGFVVVTKDPVATIGFVTCFVLIVGVVTFVVYRILTARAHFMASNKKKMEKLEGLINKAAEGRLDGSGSEKL